MKHGQKAAWFLCGVVTAALAASLVSPALAALTAKTIQVYSGVTIYVDDVKLNPTDVNGKAVEVFAYNGTTYLPVRAVSQAVGKPVQWDPATSSVYLGSHTGQSPAVWLQDLSYFTGEDLEVQSSEKDNLGTVRQDVIRGNVRWNNTYLLNGQYSAISGTLFQRYANRSDTEEVTTLKIYGDGSLLYSAKMAGGIAPIDFHVDLTGVLDLRVEFDSSGRSGLDDVGLWT